MDFFIGIDVSKKSLDLAVVQAGELVMERKIENTAAGLRFFIKELISTTGFSMKEAIVCMEHTGIYNAIALEVFWKKQIRVCVEPALRIKQSQGMTRGKSDKMDARRIASYAFKNQQDLVFWKPQRLTIQKIKVLLSLRKRLLRAKVQLEVPIREAIGFVDLSLIKQLGQSCKASLNGIKKNIKEIDDKLSEIMNLDPSINAQSKQITSVPGLGKITAANMIVVTNEFTRITEAKKFACNCGVAPFEHSSGSSIRGRASVSKLANMEMKTLLHLGAMAAINSDAEIRAFYQRKVGEGKNKMSVINAVRNKLISRAFACVNNGRLYQKEYQNALA